jgi:hypothetical protein
MSVKKAPTAAHPPARGYPVATPTARGAPIDMAQTKPMKGDAIAVFISSVQAHRSRSVDPPSDDLSSSPTCTGPAMPPRLFRHRSTLQLHELFA